MLNDDGEIVGITTMLFEGRNPNTGKSLSLGISDALYIANEIRINRRVIRGTLGINLQELTADLAQSFQLDKAEGVIITSVKTGSTAQKAGLVPADIILSINGIAVKQLNDFFDVFKKIKPDTKLDLLIFRKGEYTHVQAITEDIEK